MISAAFRSEEAIDLSFSFDCIHSYVIFDDDSVLVLVVTHYLCSVSLDTMCQTWMGKIGTETYEHIIQVFAEKNDRYY